MARYKKNRRVAPATMDEAARIASGIQQQGQTPAQTKLITQGIRKGIAQYKKQQKSKTREIDRSLKKVHRQIAGDEQADESAHEDDTQFNHWRWFPWLLLLITWLGIAAYLINPI